MVPRVFNLTGTSKLPYAQARIEKYAKPRSTLHLIRDPQNPYDRYATKACLQVNGEFLQIGWIPAIHSPEVAHFLDRGGEIHLIIREIVGGYNGYHWGVVAFIESVQFPEGKNVLSR